jgi:hypothetical protein
MEFSSQFRKATRFIPGESAIGIEAWAIYPAGLDNFEKEKFLAPCRDCRLDRQNRAQANMHNEPIVNRLGYSRGCLWLLVMFYLNMICHLHW